jgi:CheY-like chemotaxis protein
VVRLRALIVEDNADDAELVLRQLTRGEFVVTSQRVENGAGLRDALDGFEWDIVLADYSLPGFSGLEALRILNGRGIDLPLILVSGAIDVSTALAALKMGAKDFVFKDDLLRLPSVVGRAIAEASQRAQRRATEIERDRALGELREANSQLTAFARLTDFPLQKLTMDQVIANILARILKAVGADGAAVLLAMDIDGLVTAGALGPGADNPSLSEFRTRLGESIVAGNRPVYIADVAADDRTTSDGVRDSGVRSIIGVPMHYAGRVVGVLHLDWITGIEPPPWQLPLLEMAADGCAIAIENSRLFQHEHHIADTLQRALLSASISIPGIDVGHFYGSATEEVMVGGDFYDVFEITSGHVAFSIGDVSGKGLGAAPVTALVKNSLRVLAIDGHHANVVMNRSNEVVSRFTDSETLITGIFGVLDLTTGGLTYCCAGHPPAAIVGPLGVRMLTEHGPVLGAIRGAIYPSAQECLVPGESIVLYTDGLTEARNPSGVFYGDARLMSFLEVLKDSSPQDIAKRLFDEIWEFSAGKLRDDIAVLVLRPRAKHN